MKEIPENANAVLMAYDRYTKVLTNFFEKNALYPVCDIKLMSWFKKKTEIKIIIIIFVQILYLKISSFRQKDKYYPLNP